MLQAQVYERLVRTVSAGMATDEDRWDYDFIISIADSMLAWAKQQWQVKFRRLPSQWFYTYEVPFNEDLQDDLCYKRFPVPNAIIFPAGFTALNIGTRDGEFFNKYNSRIEMDNKRKHKLFQKKNGVLVEGNWAYVWTEMEIDAITVSACVANLNELDVFNPDFDDYRVTDEVLVMAEQEMKRKYMDFMAQKMPDLISNSKDTVTPQQQVSIPGTR